MRTGAGEIYLLLGTGTVAGLRDTAVAQPDVLVFVGAGPSEAAGSELWMDDVTGDGLGDLLIARQNFSPEPDRTGAGALTIVPGAAALRARAETLLEVDLAAPPTELSLSTIVGANAFDRLGIWMRTGDVTGDGPDRGSRRQRTQRRPGRCDTVPCRRSTAGRRCVARDGALGWWHDRWHTPHHLG